ncbi:MAG: hypothetical protein AAGD14_13185 [Planctomycetota bacterium]
MADELRRPAARVDRSLGDAEAAQLRRIDARRLGGPRAQDVVVLVDVLREVQQSPASNNAARNVP